MSWRIEIRPAALADITEAATWYEEQEGGLGQRFIHAVIAAVDDLTPNPLLYRLRHAALGARWCFPKHFPHRIVFRAAGDLITVVAVIHAKRHDRHWQERL